MAQKNDILKPKEALADREKMWSEIPNLPPKQCTFLSSFGFN